MEATLTANDMRTKLWTDPNVPQFKAEKALAAILAVSHALASSTNRNKYEDEFLALHDWARTIDYAAFQRVFTSPQAYHWARLAFQLLSATRRVTELPPTALAYLDVLGLQTAEEGLAYHLDQFKLLTVALACAAGRSVAFSAVPLRLPQAIPATPWSFAGTSNVQIHGFDARQGVLAILDGREAVLALPSESIEVQPGFSILVAPHFDFDDHSLVLQPHLFNVPGLATISCVVAAGVPFQWKMFDLVRRTLDVIQQYDAETYEQFAEHMRVIALKPESADEVFNTSCSRLPGAAIFTAYHHPFVLADDFIHEYYHNRLFALEEAGDYFENGEFDSIGDEQFYSPWRNDPRPLYGLFHGEYVMERVLGFWLSVLNDERIDPSTRRFAESRAACLRGQLETATEELRIFGTFSEFGRSLFEEIAAAVQEKSRRVESLGISDDTLAWTPNADGSFSPRLNDDGRQMSVAEVLCQHIERYDVFGRCHSASARTAAARSAA